MLSANNNPIVNPINSELEDLSPTLSVKDLSFYYGTKKAIEAISMDIYQGRVTAIIGPSGCGKSTFIKCLNRIS